MGQIRFTFYLLILLSAFISFIVNGKELKFNQLELKSGKVITFMSCSKVNDSKLSLVFQNGKRGVLNKQDLSNTEIIRRFGALGFAS